MKYVKLFESHSGYTAYTADTENFVKPNVSYCVQENECHMTPNKEETTMSIVVEIYECECLIKIYFLPWTGDDDIWIRVLVDGEIYQDGNDGVYPVVDGRAGFWFRSESGGTHTIDAIFDGNNKYLPCETTTSFELTPCT